MNLKEKYEATSEKEKDPKKIVISDESFALIEALENLTGEILKLRLIK